MYVCGKCLFSAVCWRTSPALPSIATSATVVADIEDRERTWIHLVVELMVYVCTVWHVLVMFADQVVLGMCILYTPAQLPASAHAVILYWAPGTAGLIVTLLPLPVFMYSPIIDTPKRITSYPVINGLVMSSRRFTWHFTAKFVALSTTRLGMLRGSDVGRTIISVYL